MGNMEWCLFAGLGFGGIYLPAIVSVATWFDKRRATAMGIAVCGTGVGVFLFSNLISYCLEKYTLQGCLLIESGVIFHVLLAAALLRPLESAQQKPAKRLEKGAAHVEMESLTSSSGRKVTLPFSVCTVVRCSGRGLRYVKPTAL